MNPPTMLLAPLAGALAPHRVMCYQLYIDNNDKYTLSLENM